MVTSGLKTLVTLQWNIFTFCPQVKPKMSCTNFIIVFHSENMGELSLRLLVATNGKKEYSYPTVGKNIKKTLGCGFSFSALKRNVWAKLQRMCSVLYPVLSTTQAQLEFINFFVVCYFFCLVHRRRAHTHAQTRHTAQTQHTATFTNRTKTKKKILSVSLKFYTTMLRMIHKKGHWQ